jgi:hypothetical protein
MEESASSETKEEHPSSLRVATMDVRALTTLAAVALTNR